ncbi:MAG: SRPBCC family protein [Chitinophagales bacterium]|nr:SRPBCC family protein [Chitinophagales bacterium]MDW8394489.1 SRPBCC family protein [Chitinophagales bacterium]
MTDKIPADTAPARLHQLLQKQTLPIPLPEAWRFFSSPLNLNLITPPDMRFRILTPFSAEDRIYPGLIIRYTVSPLWLVPLRWQTLISEVEEPFFFVDEQQVGPFRYWRHEHRFEAVGNHTEMTDRVQWSLYGGAVGRIINQYIVEPRIRQIFDFRRQKLQTLFSHS